MAVGWVVAGLVGKEVRKGLGIRRGSRSVSTK